MMGFLSDGSGVGTFWVTSSIRQHLRRSIKDDDGIQERSLIVNGAAKGYSMTGRRLGYGAGPVHLVNAITKLVT